MYPSPGWEGVQIRSHLFKSMCSNQSKPYHTRPSAPDPLRSNRTKCDHIVRLKSCGNPQPTVSTVRAPWWRATVSTVGSNYFVCGFPHTASLLAIVQAHGHTASLLAIVQAHGHTANLLAIVQAHGHTASLLAIVQAHGHTASLLAIVQAHGHTASLLAILSKNNPRR